MDEQFSYEGLYRLLEERRAKRPEGSYTTYLFEKGLDKILKKVGEECTEVIIAAKDRDHKETVYELADLAYHVLVLMVEAGISLDEVRAELGALQRPLQESGAVLIVRKKAHGIEVKIGPAGRLGRAHPQPLFQLLDLLLGALLQNLPVPLFGQFLPGGDTRGLGGPGAQDEAVAPLVFTALLKGIQEHI